MEDPQQMNVYARFVNDDVGEDARKDTQSKSRPARRAVNGAVKAGTGPAKPGLKKRAVLPK